MKYVFVTDEEIAILTHMRNESRDAPPLQVPAQCIRQVACNEPRDAPHNESRDAHRNELQRGAFLDSCTTSPMMHAHRVPRDASPQQARDAPPRYNACMLLPVARNAQVAASRLSMPLFQYDVVYDNPRAETLYALAVKQFREQEELRVQQKTELDEATHAYFEWHAHRFGPNRACIDTEEILKQALQMAPEQAKQARWAEQAEQVVRDEQFARALSLRD
jgi:hypothetical protein